MAIKVYPLSDTHGHKNINSEKYTFSSPACSSSLANVEWREAIQNWSIRAWRWGRKGGIERWRLAQLEQNTGGGVG